jgi:hypothetical protein
MPVRHPESKHPDFAIAEDLRDPCRTLMGGTKAMREAGETYLPKDSAEDQLDYENRLKRTFLFNGLRRTVLNLSARVFDQPVTVEPDDLEEFERRASRDGRSLTEFGHNLFVTALSEGDAFIYVDYPRMDGIQSRADELDAAVRPYAVEVKPEDLFFWKLAEAGSRQYLAEIRFFEQYESEDAAKGTIERKKQIRRVFINEGGAIEWEVYRENPAAKQAAPMSQGGGTTPAASDMPAWIITEDGVLQGIDEIPLVHIEFGDEETAMVSTPPLADLAEMNIAHWQSMSDQRQILHFARVPVLFSRGLSSADDKLILGPNFHIRANNPQADLKYVEHSGASISAGRQDLMDLEVRMAAMGIQLLLGGSSNPGSESATAKSISKSTEESALQIMARSLGRGLTDALELMAKWSDIPTDDVTVEVNSDFKLKLGESSEITQLMEMYESGLLDAENTLIEMQRRGFIRDEYDVAEGATAAADRKIEMERAEAERAASAERQAGAEGEEGEEEDMADEE